MTPTPLDLDALDAAERKATAAPWYQTDTPWFAHGDGVVAGSPDGNIAAYVADFDPINLARSEYEGPFTLADPEDDAAFIAALRNAAFALIAAARERDELLDELWALNEAAGFSREWGVRMDVETAGMRARQLEEGLALQNTAAAIFQPPEDLEGKDFYPWVEEQAKRIVSDRAEISHLREALEAAEGDLADLHSRAAKSPGWVGISDRVREALAKVRAALAVSSAPGAAPAPRHSPDPDR